MVQNYREIPLAELAGNPRNPRKRFTGPKFDELLASIKEKGVIEPIIVRPKKLKNTSFEIVAGERRYHAANLAGLETIPAVVRDLNDEQAFDFMLIENLQREDLTEFEEAESFKAYVGKHGEDGIPGLAEKTGISPQYIRRRMAVMALPKSALEGWSKGRLRYGHLEQLLRVKASPNFKEFFRLAMEEDRWDGQTTVEELKRRIDNESPALSLAYFPIAPEGCGVCPKNSMVQRGLFGIDDAQKSRCLDPACFKKMQNNWLLGHWDESPLHKKYGTTGFRFRDKVEYNEHESVKYSFRPDEKCKACPHFLTIIHETGEAAQGDEQECFNKACLRQRVARMRGDISKKEKEARKPGDVRVTWHGEYFRDLFFEKRIPEALAGLTPTSQEMLTLLFVTALHGNGVARDAVWEALEVKFRERWNEERLFGRILALPYAEIDKLIPKAVKAVVMAGPHVGDYNGFGTTNRFAAARFLGIDVGKEWAMTEEYLQKKTKAEIMAIGKKLKIFVDPKAKAYLVKKLKGREPDKLKKGELIDLVLKSGVELTGKVPDEILKIPKER
jgi:ParB family chromosome partitioning protein